MNPDQITTRATVADLRAGKTPPPDIQRCMTATIERGSAPLCRP